MKLMERLSALKARVYLSHEDTEKEMVAEVRAFADKLQGEEMDKRFDDWWAGQQQACNVEVAFEIWQAALAVVREMVG